MKYLLTAYLSIVLSILVRAQPAYTVLHFSSPHNCFPDTARDRGHLDGDSILQPRAGHYDDSGVLVVIPQGFRAAKTVDLVFWFHGWHNNIDTALRFYDLADQFAASGRNAILVLPEAAKNAADSYGGKMVRDGMFKLLVTDVIDELKQKGIVPQNSVAGHLVLAGHSGAYLVIANILDHGQQPVDEVFLFDALYGYVNTFTRWADVQGHHFVHWYTSVGYGPDRMSDTMMLRLHQTGKPYARCEEVSVNKTLLSENQILFIHSPRQHNVIVNKPDDFAILLKNSFYLAGPNRSIPSH
jgi:hypothetical protein